MVEAQKALTLDAVLSISKYSKTLYDEAVQMKEEDMFAPEETEQVVINQFTKMFQLVKKRLGD